MKISIRRIAAILAVVAVVSFAGSYAISGISVCPDAKACAAAVVLSGINFNTQPTALNNMVSPKAPRA
jgi:hypothetical protein